MFNAKQWKKLQPLVADAGVDGWLIFDFRGCNRIAAAVLGREIVGTRRAYVLLPRSGSPVALVHAIDNELWAAWPSQWTKHVWVTREQLAAHLKKLVGGKTLAIEYSPAGRIPYLDAVPSGVMEFLRSFKAKLVTSADLVTKYCSVWTPADIASHRRAAQHVSRIGQAAIALAGRRARTKQPITEYQLAQWILQRFARVGLVTESGPSVSFGKNAARNHYEPTATDCAKIVPGKLLLVDLWAKEPDGIYADQTWMASIGEPSSRDRRIWETILTARDAALDLIRTRIRAGKPVRGAEADAAVRAVFTAAGFEHNIEARTGHSIDRYGLHGFGPTIDDTETFDDRRLIPGVGFSVEPGIYLTGVAGARTEVNVFVGKSDVTITPHDYQRELFVV